MVTWDEDGCWVVFETPDDGLIRVPLDEYERMAKASRIAGELATRIFKWHAERRLMAARALSAQSGKR